MNLLYLYTDNAVDILQPDPDEWVEVPEEIPIPAKTAQIIAVRRNVLTGEMKWVIGSPRYPGYNYEVPADSLHLLPSWDLP